MTVQELSFVLKNSYGEEIKLTSMDMMCIRDALFGILIKHSGILGLGENHPGVIKLRSVIKEFGKVDPEVPQVIKIFQLERLFPELYPSHSEE